MDQDQVALAKLVRLPAEFRELAGVSIVELANGLDAREWIDNGGISVSSIRGHLDLDHSLVGLWLDWSGDKRCDSGAFFIEESGGYRVADRSNGTSRNTRHYDDMLEACADFIFRELESWLA